MRFYKTAAMALVAGTLLAMAPAASAQRVRSVIVYRSYPVYHWYPSPFFYGSYGYPYRYYPAYAPVETVGYVKLKTERKAAMVYVDGGYAGRAGDLSKFALSPGTHDIELRDSDRRVLDQQRVSVLLGKTTKVYLG